MFLGRTNPGLLILLLHAISKDQNVFGVLEQKIYRWLFLAYLYRWGRLELLRAVIESASVC